MSTPTGVTTSAPVVTTRSGRVRGTGRDGHFAYYGIPYAKPPTGPRWLEAPEREASWEGERDGTRPGPTAPQPKRLLSLGPETYVTGGDYLNVNVFTPDPGAAGLPVLVWIHGGGFLTGSPHASWTEPGAFVRDGIVVVSITYRLGFEGLLAVPGRPANRAVLDWLAALQWVQECVHAFGGDPGQVTIGGQSAGGEAVLTLTSLPGAPALFRRAFAMSGGLPTTADSSGAAAPESVTTRVAALLGVATDRLAGVSPAELLAVQPKIVSMFGPPGRRRFNLVDSLAHESTYLRPHADGEVVPVRPLDALAAGAFGDGHLLLGCTSEEANAAARFTARWIGEPKLRTGLSHLGLDPDGTNRYLAARREGQGAAGLDRGRKPAGPRRCEVLGQAMTDRLFRSNVGRVAELRAATGAPTWCYEFRQPSTAVFGLLGAVHCVDLPYVFDAPAGRKRLRGNEPGPRSEAARRLTNEVHGAFRDFVRTGDPGWPAYRPPSRPVRAFPGSVEDDVFGLVRSLWP